MTLISLANRELQEAVETWRERDLSEERYKYLFIDGLHFKMSVKDSIENIPVFAVIGVNQDGYKTVLALQQGDKACLFFGDFEKKWQKELPSAVKCLAKSLPACLTYLDFPEEEWISLRTTNVIERLNKEFKRRTRPMEIVAGENSCYRLLAFISLKMEMHWRSTPVGKVQKNLPFFKQINGL